MPISDCFSILHSKQQDDKYQYQNQYTQNYLSSSYILVRDCLYSYILVRIFYLESAELSGATAYLGQDELLFSRKY